MSKRRSLDTLCAALAYAMKVDAPECAAKANPELVAYIDEKLEEAKQKVLTNFEFVYPYSHIADLPAKLSVSKLHPGVLDRTEDTSEDSDVITRLDAELPPLRSTPSFMYNDDKKASISGAERGIATHTFLQFCDFERAYSAGSENELYRLIDNGFISSSYGELVNLRQIDKFFSSKLFKEISTAKWLKREQRFNILLPARLFTKNDILYEKIKGEDLLVQGVIDIFFENADGKLILCDYKTDHLTKDELSSPELARQKLEDAHADQLSYYAEALRAMIGKYPDKVLIYSLPLGDAVEICINKELLG